MRTLAVAGVAAGTLAFEILLVRAFGIQHFHHFAYMAIGVAMFGFGASGTALALVRPRAEGTRADWFVRAALSTAIALIASPVLIERIPLDPTQLAWALEEWLSLGLVYLLLAVPFGAGALAVLLAISLEPGRPGRLYGASFLGSGIGAGAALASLFVLSPTRALAVPALIASLGAVCAALGTTSGTRVARTIGSLLVAAASCLMMIRPPWHLTVTPYKALPQVEAYPEAVQLAERSSPLGWVVAVQAPAFRYAPGLSLNFTGELPRQTGLFVDGELAGAATQWQDAESALAVLDQLPSALPYALGNRNRVLVIGSGGGMEVTNALAHGAERVTAVELHPGLNELARAHGRPSDGFAGQVRWVAGDARQLISSSPDRYDLITLGPGGGLGASGAGVHALGEDFLSTTNAYARYLSRLTPDGVLAVTGWLATPPRQNVRVILTLAEALRRVAPPGHVVDGLVVARSWGTVTVLAKPTGFSSSDIAALDAWAEPRSFDLDWYPGGGGGGGRDGQPARPVFNQLDEPVFSAAAASAVAGPREAKAFAESYPFDVAPVGDGRPYPHHFLRLRSLGVLLGTARGSWLPFAEWGALALVATLVQSVALALVLLVLPVAVRARRRETGLFPVIGYFAAIGLAYLAAEIAAIQQLGLLLGHPVYAVAATLSAFLVFSGIGAAWSDRVQHGRGALIAGVLSVILVGYAGGLLPVVHALEWASPPVRAVLAMALLAPLALLMGMPFPVGVRRLATGQSRLAWAWAANGFASVVGAPLAVLVALELGAGVVLLVAAGAYGMAAILVGAFTPGNSTA